MDDAQDVIKRYLQDCIAAERNFESQLRSFAKEGEQDRVRMLFARHADETKRQYERLEARLHEIGGSPSTMRTFIAHMFGFAPRNSGFGDEEEERNTQDLMMAYSVECAEQAIYEALATVANAAGDEATERLAREIQGEQRATAEKVWALLAPSARDSFLRMTGAQIRTA